MFVGNLSWNTDNHSLRDGFSRYGEVTDAFVRSLSGRFNMRQVLKDRETGRSRGFGFVTFGNTDEANAALAMDGQDLDGRSVRVNLANSR